MIDKINVLLLGGSGYLGAQLKHDLEKEKCLRTIITYYNTKPQDSSNFIKLDITNKVQVLKTLNLTEPDVIIWSLMSDSEDILINEGLENLLTFLKPSTKLIFISTDGVFSQGTGHFSEEDVPQLLDSKNPLSTYTNAKLIAEQKIRKAHLNSIIVRIGPIYGTNIDGVLDGRTKNLLEDFKINKIISKPTNLYKTFIHVKDISSSIVELVTNNYNGIFHLGPLSKESYYTFSKKRAAKFGKDPSYIKDDTISFEDAIHRAVPLDTSLNTEKANRILHTKFRI